MDLFKVMLGLYLGTRTLTGGVASAGPSAPAYVRDSAAKQGAVSVAVMPFANLSDDPQADRKLIGFLVTRLLATGAFTVTEPALVETALGDMRVRSDMDATQMKEIAGRLGVRLLLMGTISEYGAPRGGGASLTATVSARIVDTSTTTIVWATVATRSAGRDDSLFGSGTPSMTRLTQQVINQLVGNMVKGQRELSAFSKPLPPAPQPPVTTPVPQTTDPSAPTTPPTTTPTAPAGAPEPRPAAGTSLEPPTMPAVAPKAAKRNLADGAELTIADLSALLPEKVGGAERGDVAVVESCQPTVEALYRIGGSSLIVRVVDHGTTAQAAASLKSRSGTAAEAPFDTFPSRAYTSDFGFVHVNVVFGRLAVYVRGPSEREEIVRKVSSAILKELR